MCWLMQSEGSFLLIERTVVPAIVCLNGIQLEKSSQMDMKAVQSISANIVHMLAEIYQKNTLTTQIWGCNW